MIAMRLISQDHLHNFVDKLIETNEVIGVTERAQQPGSYYFTTLTTAADLRLEYDTTTIPPKKIFFPLREELFQYANQQIMEGNCSLSPLRNRILIAVHPCDLAAIDQLDKAYRVPPHDPNWARQRHKTIIIGTDCLPDEYCFCQSVGTCDSRLSCDLFLNFIGGRYLVEIHSTAGDALLAQAVTTEPKKDDLADNKLRKQKKQHSMKAKLDATMPKLASLLREDKLRPIWEDVATRCYSCGSCNTTCPTCICFNISDHLNLSLNNGWRERTWDSCQLTDFALVAGGSNFRIERWQRVRHRWRRKFLYLYEQLGRPYCTGCGRCSRACTADINIVDVTNRLIHHQAHEEPK